MDPTSTSKKKKAIILLGLGGVSLAALVSGLMLGRSHSHSADVSTEVASQKKEIAASAEKAVPKSGEHAENRHSFFTKYIEAWASFRVKVDEVSAALQENERLRVENAELRLRLETNDFECREKIAANRSDDYGLMLQKQTGTKVGRSLANLSYQPPSHLLPSQLFTLGVSYFKAHEDEKAAVIFTMLTELREGNDFKSGKNFLLTGVAWYHLDNFELADQFFTRALEADTSPEFHAQARLWRSIVALKLGNHKISQELLQDLIATHPHSVEAQWINPTVSKSSEQSLKTVSNINAVPKTKMPEIKKEAQREPAQTHPSE